MTKRLDGFSDIEHIDKIKTVLLPRVELFSKEIDSYKHEMAQIREIIRRFDEAISIKASKTSLTIV